VGNRGNALPKLSGKMEKGGIHKARRGAYLLFDRGKTRSRTSTLKTSKNVKTRKGERGKSVPKKTCRISRSQKQPEKGKKACEKPRDINNHSRNREHSKKKALLNREGGGRGLF